jgi:hypothetical protein
MMSCILMHTDDSCVLNSVSRAEVAACVADSCNVVSGKQHIDAEDLCP